MSRTVKWGMLWNHTMDRLEVYQGFMFSLVGFHVFPDGAFTLGFHVFPRRVSCFPRGIRVSLHYLSLALPRGIPPRGTKPMQITSTEHKHVAGRRLENHTDLFPLRSWLLRFHCSIGTCSTLWVTSVRMRRVLDLRMERVAGTCSTL